MHLREHLKNVLFFILRWKFYERGKDMKRINTNHYQTSERYYKIPKLLFESIRYKDMKLEVKMAHLLLFLLSYP